MHWRALLLAGLCVAAPARAGLFDDDEARKQVSELRQSIESLDKRLDGAVRNQIDFANQNEALKSEVARLRGQVEELAHAVESAHKRQQDFYVDLDNRLRKLETAATPATAGGGEGAASSLSVADPPPAKPADPQAEMRDYETALGLLREGRFKEAQSGFESFIAKHPQSPLLPNAHYWLGSSLYQQKGFLQATAIFGKIPAQWPQDAKAPDALLQQANALVGAKDVPGAIKVLESLVEKYPTNPAAETARARLKTLAPQKKR